MLTKLKFPWLYVLELICWGALLPAFVFASVFVASQPISQLNLSGKSLPSHWEAAVPNHGKYLEGYLIHNHPVAFACVLTTLAASVSLLYLIYRAQQAQQASAVGREATAHRVARFVVFGLLVVIGYVALTLSCRRLAGLTLGGTDGQKRPAVHHDVRSRGDSARPLGM
jgi:hypothetical protein